MYGPKKKKTKTLRSIYRDGEMVKKDKKRKQANMGRMMYNDGGMTPAKPN